MKLLVTGGAGFIGSAFVRYALTSRPDLSIVTLDKLTYAGNLENLAPVAGDPRHTFVHGDICDGRSFRALLAEHRIDAIVHFAAESHVDRSILSPHQAIETNVRGTGNAAGRGAGGEVRRFLLVSTDEVYGDIDEPFEADELVSAEAEQSICGIEGSRRSAGAGLRADVQTAGGHYARLEQLRTLSVPGEADPADDLERHGGPSLPVYGDGLQVRDWLYVDDHCRAILAVLERGREARFTTSPAPAISRTSTSSIRL